MSNPYGASCGTSIVVAPSVAKVQSGKIGTRGARLSDTTSGKAPKRTRTREELESMAKHPAGKALTKHEQALEHDDKCKCYCTKVKSVMAELDELLSDAFFDELNALANELREAGSAMVRANIEEEANREKAKAEAVKAHLYLVGDNDA